MTSTNLEFLSSTLEVVRTNRVDNGKSLREEIRTLRRNLREACNADVSHMPCGADDAYFERLEECGNKLMTMIHAYLMLKYGTPTKRLAAMFLEVTQ